MISKQRRVIPGTSKAEAVAEAVAEAEAEVEVVAVAPMPTTPVHLSASLQTRLQLTGPSGYSTQLRLTTW